MKQEKELLSGKCEICNEKIVIDYYMDQDDIVTCEECGSDFLIKSLSPLQLSLIEEEEEEDGYFDEDDYFTPDYD